MSNLGRSAGIPSKKRQPPLPKGERAHGHAASGGEESPDALANNGHTAIPTAPLTGDAADASTCTEIEINRATARLAIYPHAIAKDPEAHKARKCGGKESCAACRLVDALYGTQRVTSRAKNALVRKYWQLDGDALDGYMVENGGATPKSYKQWPMAKVYGYQFLAPYMPDVASGIRSQAAREVETKWKQIRYDALVHCSVSPPHYRDTGAFTVRKQEVRFSKTGKDKYVIRLNLHPGRHPGGAEFEIPVKARDSYQRGILGELAKKEDDPSKAAKHATISLTRDRRNRWFVRMAYTRKVPKAVGTKSAAINRGMKCFLVGIAEGAGKPWIYDGNDIEAYLKQIQARRRSYQYDSPASGRSGRGRTRMLRPIEKLEAKGQRWRETKCQTVARRFTDWLIGKDIGRLYIEDFSGIRNGPEEALEGGKYIWDRIQEWPYYQLETRLVSCAEEAGIEVVKVPAHNISKTCPSCGKPAKPDRRHWRLRCESCGFKRHLDVAAAMNVLARGKAAALKRLKDSGGLGPKQKSSKGGTRKKGRNGANGKGK